MVINPTVVKAARAGAKWKWLLAFREEIIAKELNQKDLLQKKVEKYETVIWQLGPKLTEMKKERDDLKKERDDVQEKAHDILKYLCLYKKDGQVGALLRGP